MIYQEQHVILYYYSVFQAEGGVIHTFKGKANEWNLKRMIKSEIRKCQKGTCFLVMFGIHGSQKGFLDVTDEKLSFSFNAALDAINRTERNILKENDIKIERLEIQTQKLENGRLELVDKFKVAEKSKNCEQLVLCFCFTRVNESNSFFRSTGLYSDLYMNQDLSNRLRNN